MFLLVSLSKSDFFTLIALVSFVQHSRRSCNTRVAFVSHSRLTRVALVLNSCLTRVASVAFVSHLCRQCRTRFPHVWHSCCKLDEIFKIVSLLSHSCRQCRTRVAFVSLVSLVSGTRVVDQTRSIFSNSLIFNFMQCFLLFEVYCNVLSCSPFSFGFCHCYVFVLLLRQIKKIKK